MSRIPVSREDVRHSIREFILGEFLPGEDMAILQDTTPLITGGILDSIATVRLVVHLENTFKIVIKQNEVTINNLDTVTLLVELVEKKLIETNVESE